VGRLASLSSRIRLVQRNTTTWSNKSGHFAHKQLRLWHVDEYQARSGEVECVVGQTCLSCIGMENIDVCEVLVRNELSRTYDLFSAAFDTNYSAHGTDTFGEKTKASLWTTTNLDCLPAWLHTNLTKQPS
jgi:hypothetical protein